MLTTIGFFVSRFSRSIACAIRPDARLSPPGLSTRSTTARTAGFRHARSICAISVWWPRVRPSSRSLPLRPSVMPPLAYTTATRDGTVHARRACGTRPSRSARGFAPSPVSWPSTRSASSR